MSRKRNMYILDMILSLLDSLDASMTLKEIRNDAEFDSESDESLIRPKICEIKKQIYEIKKLL